MPDACITDVFLIVEKITQAERDELAEIYGTEVIASAMNNARALQIIRAHEEKEAAIERKDWTPPAYAEIRREEEQAGLEKIMRSRQGGRLGSET